MRNIKPDKRKSSALIAVYEQSAEDLFMKIQELGLNVKSYDHIACISTGYALSTIFMRRIRISRACAPR